MSENYLISGPVTSGIISHLMNQMALKTDSGGHTFFLGQVRADEVGGKRVKAIDYSAYESLVSAEAESIKESVFSEFDDLKAIVIIHSTGIVRSGEISLVVLVSAGHRQQAMLACCKTLELIKERLPVWKKEIFEDDTYEWKNNE